MLGIQRTSYLLLALLISACGTVEELTFWGQPGDVFELTGEHLKTYGPDREVRKISERGSSLFIERVLTNSGNDIELIIDLPDDSIQQLSELLPIRLRINADGEWVDLDQDNEHQCDTTSFGFLHFQPGCLSLARLQIARQSSLRQYELAAGAFYTDPLGIRPARLSPEQNNQQRGIEVLSASIPLDPDAIRRERAFLDIALGKYEHQKEVTLEEALARQQAFDIHGQVDARFELDRKHHVYKLFRTANITIVGPEGDREVSKRSITVTNRLISGPSLTASSD
ncbi:MAG: hypothetical protein HRU11_13035 [Parvularculaceae bacterium]|nr:hypothetical protein [Parvularculaceae bacterium]